jgi:hypothetical protein
MFQSIHQLLLLLSLTPTAAAMRPFPLLLLCTCAWLCTSRVAAADPAPPIPRPDHTEHARLARWIAHYNTWGTLATQASSDAPATAGVVSYADGGPVDSPAAGRMFFYLTPMDETGGHIQVRGSCTLHRSFVLAGSCGSARLTMEDGAELPVAVNYH